MILSLNFRNYVNFLLLVGILSIPLSFLLSREVFLGFFTFSLLFLFFIGTKRTNLLNWSFFTISIIYLFLTSLLRLDYYFVSVRLLVVILTIFIASIYCRNFNTEDLLKLAKIIIILGFLSAILGLNQFIFGYSKLDLSLLAKTLGTESGSLFDDFLKYGRSRSLGILFDPFGHAIFMGITLHCIILVNKIKNRFYMNYLLMIIVFLSLLATLNRTGILATLISMLIYINITSFINFFRGISWIIKLFYLVIFIWIILSILKLSEFENVNIGITSILRAFGVYDNSEVVGDYFSRGKSLEIRLELMSRVGGIFLDYPFGIKEPPKGFSTNDVGIFSPILKYGLIGGTGIIFILLRPLIGLLKFYFLRKSLDSNNDIVRFIYSIYIIVLVTNLLSFSLDGTILMLPLWIIIFMGVAITNKNKKFDKF